MLDIQKRSVSLILVQRPRAVHLRRQLVVKQLQRGIRSENGMGGIFNRVPLFSVGAFQHTVRITEYYNGVEQNSMEISFCSASANSKIYARSDVQYYGFDRAIFSQQRQLGYI